jgi:hypothetical protein
LRRGFSDHQIADSTATDYVFSATAIRYPYFPGIDEPERESDMDQCIGFLHPLEQLGLSKETWESWSVRLQPPGTYNFDDAVLAEALATPNAGLRAAALMFRAEFAREKGQDHEILGFFFKAVEELPDNPATLDALVENLESFHRPADALPFAERHAQVDSSPTVQWMLGKIKYLSGDKTGAIEFWKTLPFYLREDGPDTLKLYTEGCERRLAQYAAYKASLASQRRAE